MAEEDQHTADTAAEYDIEEAEQTVPEDIIREKALAEIRLAERKQRLEEYKARAKIDQQSESFFANLAGLPEDIIRIKVQADITLDERKMRLEELRVEHEIDLANRIETFNQAEKIKLTKIMTQNESQHWLRKYWRAAAGWTYLIICMFDFVIAPVLWAVLPHYIKSMPTEPWQPHTLMNGGLVHISFGAILGVAAWTRGQSDMMRTKIASTKVLND